MAVTLFLSILLMAALFLLLYAAVALIQDRRLFTSAPKVIQAAVQPKPERFPGQHILGWLLLALAVLCYPAAFVYGAWEGAREGFGFWRFFLRFLLMLLLNKAFDVLFFDWFLLGHSRFFPRYYPETEKLVGPHHFGYNRKDHLTHVILFVPACLLLAWLATVIF